MLSAGAAAGTCVAGITRAMAVRHSLLHTRARTAHTHTQGRHAHTTHAHTQADIASTGAKYADVQAMRAYLNDLAECLATKVCERGCDARYV
jgi:hypothetical protein